MTSSNAPFSLQRERGKISKAEDALLVDNEYRLVGRTTPILDSAAQAGGDNGRYSRQKLLERMLGRWKGDGACDYSGRV